MFVINVSLIYALLGVLGLICLNTILGVAVAIVQNTFSLNKLPQFLANEVLPYGMSLSALVGAAQLNMAPLASKTGGVITKDGLSAVAWTAIGFYVLRMLQDIGKKLFILFGVNIPVTENKPPAHGVVEVTLRPEGDTVTGYQTGDHILPGATKFPGQPG